jgi:hypothetical protein
MSERPTVIPAKAGIQKFLLSWIPDRGTPDCDPGLPGMTPKLFNGFREHDTSGVLVLPA